MTIDDPQDLAERGSVCRREQAGATTPPGNGLDSDPLLDCEASASSQSTQSDPESRKDGGERVPGAEQVWNAGQAEDEEEITEALPRFKDQVVGHELSQGGGNKREALA